MAPIGRSREQTLPPMADEYLRPLPPREGLDAQSTLEPFWRAECSLNSRSLARCRSEVRSLFDWSLPDTMISRGPMVHDPLAGGIVDAPRSSRELCAHICGRCLAADDVRGKIPFPRRKPLKYDPLF